MGDIKKAVRWITKIAMDDTHGYDQAKRNGPDYDCSSLVATALNRSGFNIPVTSFTGNLFNRLNNLGFKVVTAPFKAGDIHLTPYKHCAMSIDEHRIVQATINEKGKTTGGTTGDQTGKEIGIFEYYDYPWTYHLRYDPKELHNSFLIDVAMDVIRGKYGNGSERKKKLERQGYNYTEVQSMVNYILGEMD